jgi:D-alanyl-D-alanine carboxypeptidase (penicillin-binding protein 5/6)
MMKGQHIHRSASATAAFIILLTVLVTWIISPMSLGTSVSFLSSGADSSVYAANDDEDDSAKYAKKPATEGAAVALMDAKTGQILFSKKMNKKLEPASTTKIMTALLVLENLKLDDIVTVTDEAREVNGASVMILPGEEIPVGDLLYAALLESGNDAATALAIAVDEDVETFVAHMNTRAAELGAVNTHFVSPHGLHDDDHYSTAYDLALIAREAMKNEDFRRYVGTYEHEIDKTNLQPARLFHNANRLLYSEGWHVVVYGERRVIKYDDALGIKTGYTVSARNTLVAGAQRGGLELIAVSLKTEGVAGYQDVIGMFEYGFHNFQERTVVVKGEPLETVDFEVSVEGANVPKGSDSEVVTVGGVAASDIIATIKNNQSDVSKVITVTTSAAALTAPVTKGQVIGHAVVTVGKGNNIQIIGETDLLADTSVEKKKKLFAGISLPKIIPKILKVVGVIIGIAVLWIVIVIIRSEKQKRDRRNRRMYTTRGDMVTREVKRIKRIK